MVKKRAKQLTSNLKDQLLLYPPISSVGTLVVRIYAATPC